MFCTAATNDAPKLKFCTQIVPIAILKIPTNPINTGFIGIYLFIQTPLRTAFHDTQRLLLEVYISNVRSVFVFFAPLMKK